MEIPPRPGALKKTGEVVVESLGGIPITQPASKAARTGEGTDMEEDGRTDGEAVGVSGVEDGVGVVSAAGSDERSFPQVSFFPGGDAAGIDASLFGAADIGKGQGYSTAGASSTPYPETISLSKIFREVQKGNRNVDQKFLAL